MIERYALPEIAGLFTDEARFRAWSVNKSDIGDSE